MANSTGLAAGIALASVAWLGLAIFLLFRHGPFPWFLVGYNVPITLVFAGLVVHMVWTGTRLERSQIIASYAPLGVVWLIGGVVLFLRLVTQSIDVSGHMVWSVMMGVQCSVHRLPFWFTASAWAVVLQVLLLKLFVIGGHSGQKGIVIGILLGVAVWFTTRAQKDVRSLGEAQGIGRDERGVQKRS
jgi:hypothetical protein